MLTSADATYAEDYSLNADTRSRSTALTRQAKTEQKRRPERREGSASMMLRLGTPLPLALLSECFLFSLHPLSFCFLLFGVHPLGILRDVVQQGAKLGNAHTLMAALVLPHQRAVPQPCSPRSSPRCAPQCKQRRTRWRRWQLHKKHSCQRRACSRCRRELSCASAYCRSPL